MNSPPSPSATRYGSAAGFIVRRVRYAESSLILTWYTRERGRIRTVARGALGPRSRLRGTVDLFALCRVVFTDRPDRELRTLKEASLERSFAEIARETAAYHAGVHVLELLDVATADDAPDPDLFDAAVTAFVALANGYGHGHVLAFERALLTGLGRFPTLDRCDGCGADAARPGAGWDASAQVVSCPECRPRSIPALPESIVGWWRDPAVPLPEPDARRLGRLTRIAIDHAVERRLQTRDLVPLHARRGQT